MDAVHEIVHRRFEHFIFVPYAFRREPAACSHALVERNVEEKVHEYA